MSIVWHRPWVVSIGRIIYRHFTARVVARAVDGIDASAVLLVLPFGLALFNVFSENTLAFIGSTASFFYLWMSLVIGLYYTRELRRSATPRPQCPHCKVPLLVATFRCGNCKRAY